MKNIVSLMFGFILLAACVAGCGGGGAAPNTTPSPQTDTSPPSVISTYPGHTSTGIALNSAITVTFNEAIDPATIINKQTFTLTKDGTPVEGSFTFVDTSAMFKPAGSLSANASYTATVTTGVKDLAGNPLTANYSWSFTTGSAADSDVVPPQVLSVSPPDGATNVPVNSPLVVTFNEPIMPFDFGQIDGRPVAVTFNDTYTTATMTPTVALKSGTTYNASIQIKDMAGNEMPAAFTWRFSTSP